MSPPHIPPKNRLLRAKLRAKAMKLSMPYEGVIRAIVVQMVSRVKAKFKEIELDSH